MRPLVLLFALVAAGPVLAQTSAPSSSGRSASLPLPVRPQAEPEEVLPSAAIYSWVDEADGRFVVVQGHGYLTPAQRTAWASGVDEAAADTSASLLSPGDGDWPGSAVVTCDVLKCVQTDALGARTRPAAPLPRS